MAELKIIFFDLDGTLTQHRSPLGDKNRAMLDRLSKKYRLVMVGAGTCQRIWNQMGHYPIDIIGSYGMQFAEYSKADQQLHLQWNEVAPVDREKQIARANLIRDKFDLHEYTGDTLEIHPTGALTFPVLGTAAKIEDKLAYDPDRSKRRAMYSFVKEVFSDYNVMVGGSSSFDIVPGQYGKLNAIKRFLKNEGIGVESVVYCGDDYYEGGNDYDVFTGGIPFIKVDDYQTVAETVAEQGLLY